MDLLGGYAVVFDRGVRQFDLAAGLDGGKIGARGLCGEREAGAGPIGFGGLCVGYGGLRAGALAAP